MKEKANLTIRIDKEVLEKAKELELNLSATTEGFLKVASLIQERKLVTAEELRSAYSEVFRDILEILKKWGITWYIKIGGYTENANFRSSDGKSSFYPMTHIYYLTPAEKIEDYVDEIEESVKTWNLNEDWPTDKINNSQKIVSELVDTIYRSAMDNKKRLGDMAILKSVLHELKKTQKEKDEEH